MSKLALLVNGIEFAGWKSMRVTRGIEAISGAFELEVSDRWGQLVEAWQIVEEDECQLLIDGRPVITGFVDKRGISFSEADHSLTVSGRDKTGAFVDSSAFLQDGGKKKWEFHKVDVLALAKKLAAPFGIDVTLQPGFTLAPASHKLTIDPGETAFEVLDRACKLVGVLPISDGLGGLVLTRAGVTRAVTSLVQGQNIKAASLEIDATGRFYRYIVMGQHAGNDTLFGTTAAGPKGEATDENVRRTERVLLVRPDQVVTSAFAKQRAQWEATVRAARSGVVTVTVQGWTQSDGTLWPVNALVPLQSPFLGIDSDMLITQATYSRDESNGTTTQLTLKSPASFLPEPILGKKQKTVDPWKGIERGV